MANRIKGITIEIGGDTTKLDKALAGTNKELKSTQSQLKDVERLLKMDPGNTELLAQKQRLLGPSRPRVRRINWRLSAVQPRMQIRLWSVGKAYQERIRPLKRELDDVSASMRGSGSQRGKHEAKIGRR